MAADFAANNFDDHAPAAFAADTRNAGAAVLGQYGNIGMTDIAGI